jgi:FkbM family methyltransferase
MLITSIKKIIYNSLRKRGLMITPVHNGFSLNNNTEWLKEYSFDTILDVGANMGQFAKFINKLFPKATIYSFEPIKECFEKLKINNPEVENYITFNFALGDDNTEHEFFKNEFSASSSLLPMEDEHIKSFPFTKNTNIEKIAVKKLDDIYKTLNVGKKILFKIDVQGFEDKVIDGSINFINEYSPMLIIETSFIRLYQNESLFEDIYNRLRKLDYSYKGNLDQLYSPRNGAILQGDAIFVRMSNRI